MVENKASLSTRQQGVGIPKIWALTVSRICLAVFQFYACILVYNNMCPFLQNKLNLFNSNKSIFYVNLCFSNTCKMACTLRNAPLPVQRYLLDHFIPELFESIISGVIVLCPEDPFKFMIECLHRYKEKDYDWMLWSMFIPDYKKNDYLYKTAHWVYSEEHWKPDPEKWEIAIKKDSVTRLTYYFEIWKKYHHYMKMEVVAYLSRWFKAKQHYDRYLLRKYFALLREFVSYVLQRQSEASAILSEIADKVLLDNAFSLFQDNLKYQQLAIKMGSDHPTRTIIARSVDLSKLPPALESNAFPLVFQYLNVKERLRCREVCKEWAELVERPIVWKTVDFSAANFPFLKPSTQIVVNTLQAHSDVIEDLNFEGYRNINDSVLKAISGCAQLKKLNLSKNRDINDDSWKIMILKLTNLEEVDVSGTKIGDIGVRLIVTFAKRLHTLNLRNCVNITNRGLVFMTRGKTKDWVDKIIKKVDISANPQFSTEGRAKLVNALPTLHTLYMDNIVNLADDDVVEVLGNAQELRKLYIREDNYLENETLETILSMPLEVLYFCDNSDVNNKAFSSISNSMKVLSLSRCYSLGDKAVKLIASQLSLVSLDLQGWEKLTDAGITSLCSSSNKNTLRILCLKGCESITDDAMEGIGKHLSNLNYLDITFCKLTETGYLHLSPLEKLSSLHISGPRFKTKTLEMCSEKNKLRFLTVCGNHSLFDEDLPFLLKQYSPIQFLDMTSNSSLTDEGIKAITKACRHLTTLIVSACSLLTDKSLLYISAFSVQLQRLEIDRCPTLTDKGLSFVIQGLRLLRFISIAECSFSPNARIQLLLKDVQVGGFREEEEEWDE